MSRLAESHDGVCMKVCMSTMEVLRRIYVLANSARKREESTVVAVSSRR